jgi:hypothetical protein
MHDQLQLCSPTCDQYRSAMRDTCLTPTLLYQRDLLSSLVADVDDENAKLEKEHLDSSPAARRLKSNLTEAEVKAVNGYLDDFRVPVDDASDSRMQVLARLAARHAQLELVFLDGMPAELAREFGYASVGVVHDMCCETFSSCRTIVPAWQKEAADGAEGTFDDMVAQLMDDGLGNLIVLVAIALAVVLLVFARFCIIRIMRSRTHAYATHVPVV